MDETLYNQISASNALRQSRGSIADYIAHNPDFIKDVFSLGCDTKDRNHHKAMWSLELVFENNIAALHPYLEQYFSALKMWKHDGAQRSAAKIGMLAAVQHCRSTFLTNQQLQQLAEQCFDWLIDDCKVAVKS